MKKVSNYSILRVPRFASNRVKPPKSIDRLVTEVAAWQQRRNQQRKTIDWTFTREKADKKLAKYYVA
jgi:hypothetical protein